MNEVGKSGFGCRSRFDWARWIPSYRSSGASLLSEQQGSSHHEQIGQRAGHEQAIGILGDAAVAHLGETEEAFDHQKRALAFRPHPRFVSILGAFGIGQRPVAARLGLGKVAGLGRHASNRFGLPDVGRVTPHPCFIAMQQLRQFLAIVHVGRRRYHRVDS